jgi:hypothetical protein
MAILICLFAGYAAHYWDGDATKTTQYHLREINAAQGSQSRAYEGDWFLKVTRMIVAQGHSAGPAASCGSDTGILTYARHASVL